MIEKDVKSLEINPLIALKEQAVKENNIIVYGSILHWEGHHDPFALLETMYKISKNAIELAEKVTALESEKDYWHTRHKYDQEAVTLLKNMVLYGQTDENTEKARKVLRGIL